MINQDKWISSLPGKNTRSSNTTNQLDHDKWINTIPKKNTHNPFQKYSLMTILFVCGLLFVSVVKNETRNLQKKINNLETSVNVIKFNLDQAILDNEVITSPENISRLAKEYLNTNYVSYKKNQIKNIDNDNAHAIPKLDNTNNKLTKKIQLEMIKKIKRKKTEIRKLQELYSKPESIPGEIKTQVAIKIKEKKTQLKKLYSSPKETFTIKKAQKWAAVQVVKVFLGMPVIPGK
jgi:MFS superfamily sulfate permease-like transporter